MMIEYRSRIGALIAALALASCAEYEADPQPLGAAGSGCSDCKDKDKNRTPSSTDAHKVPGREHLPEVWDQPEPIDDFLSRNLGTARRHGTCGPTAAANILKWYEIDQKPADIEPKTREKVGVSGSKLKSYFNDNYPDLKTKYGTGKSAEENWKWLDNRIKAGYPVMTGLAWVKDGEDWGNFPTGHWVVVVGTGSIGGKRVVVIEHWSKYEIAYWDQAWDGMRPFQELWSHGYDGWDSSEGNYPAVWFDKKPTKFKTTQVNVPKAPEVWSSTGGTGVQEYAPFLSPPVDFEWCCEECVQQCGDGLCEGTEQADGCGDCDGLAACETDADADGTGDLTDNCVFADNADQADADGDGVGDACDSCAATWSYDQADTDADGVGDACDSCPSDANDGQDDADADGIGDACDPDSETDGDGIPDIVDLCPADYDPDQLDTDGDGLGNACDPDDDNDGEDDWTDLDPEGDGGPGPIGCVEVRGLVGCEAIPI